MDAGQAIVATPAQTPPRRLNPVPLWSALRIPAPTGSILALWYLAIAVSGLPSFVIPRPERVL